MATHIINNDMPMCGQKTVRRDREGTISAASLAGRILPADLCQGCIVEYNKHPATKEKLEQTPEKEKPFDAVSRDGFVASRVVYHAALYPQLRQTAREHGYALALHGSLTKDLDVLAVPWVADAADAETLVKALVERAGGFLVGPPYSSDKPHGRRAWTIHLGGNGGYVDLSIVGAPDGS